MFNSSFNAAQSDKGSFIRLSSVHINIQYTYTVSAITHHADILQFDKNRVINRHFIQFLRTE